MSKKKAGPITPNGNKTGEYVFLFLLLAFSVFFLFYGLGTRYLWQDEAQTPLIAKTILHSGFPYGTDGVNFFSQDGGIEYGRNYLWKWHPWLPFYVSAAGIKIFGIGNLAYRLPFALFGLATILLVYFMIRRLYGSWQKAAFCAVSVAFSTAFLLLARQCRYYSVEMFFVIGALLFYAEYVARKKDKALAWLFIFLACLFHTLYIYFFIMIAALGLHQLLSAGKRDKKAIATLAAAFFFNLPFLFTLYFIKFSQANNNMFDLTRVFSDAGTYLIYALKYLFPWFALIIAAALAVNNLLRKKPLSAGGGAGNILALFTVTAFVLVPIMTHTPFLRNITGTVVPLAVLAGLLCFKIFERNKIAGAVLMAAIILASPLPKFAGEITSDWEEAGECIVKFINQNSSPGDEVLITYPDMPVKLYTNLKVHGGITGDDITGIKKPAFVIFRREIGSEFEKTILQYIEKNIDLKEYTLYRLPCADKVWENREDIQFHDFGPDHSVPGVFLYMLNKNNMPSGGIPNGHK